MHNEVKRKMIEPISSSATPRSHARDKKKKRARNDKSRELFAESRVHFAKDEC